MSGSYTPFKITVECAREDTIRETEIAKAIYSTADALARVKVTALEHRIEGFVRQRDRDQRYIDALVQALEAADIDVPDRP